MHPCHPHTMQHLLRELRLCHVTHQSFHFTPHLGLQSRAPARTAPQAAAGRNAAAPAPAARCHLWHCQRQADALLRVKWLRHEAVGDVWPQQRQQCSGLALAGDEVLRVAAPARMAAATSSLVSQPLAAWTDQCSPPAVKLSSQQTHSASHTQRKLYVVNRCRAEELLHWPILSV